MLLLLTGVLLLTGCALTGFDDDDVTGFDVTGFLLLLVATGFALGSKLAMTDERPDDSIEGLIVGDVGACEGTLAGLCEVGLAVGEVGLLVGVRVGTAGVQVTVPFTATDTDRVLTHPVAAADSHTELLTSNCTTSATGSLQLDGFCGV